MLSPKCSSLIDVLKYATYNIHMDENAVVNLRAMETATPKWRIARSAGAVYVMLIVLMICCISIANLLYTNWQIPRQITQPTLYILIAICGFFLYRRHYICYRYTLTDDLFAIERVGGNAEKTTAVIAIEDIQAIFPFAEKKNISGKMVHAFLPPKETHTFVKVKNISGEITYSISASAEFIHQLTAQWQSVIRSQNITKSEPVGNHGAERTIDQIHG